jgi:hypothetical protein
MKVDLADGYYRIPLAPEAALELAVVLPPDNTSTNLIGIPLSLPMGWKNSPPFFYFTETVADIANANLNVPMPPHALEQCAQVAPILDIHHYAISAVLPPPDTCRQTPLQYVNVYIDDFIAAAQRPTITRTARALFHALDNVFSDTPDSPHRLVVSKSLTKETLHGITQSVF